MLRRSSICRAAAEEARGVRDAAEVELAEGRLAQRPAVVAFAAAVVLVVVREVEIVHLVALGVDAKDVLRRELAGADRRGRWQGHLRRRLEEPHRVAAVQEHRGAVREDVEHALGASGVDVVHLVVALAPRPLRRPGSRHALNAHAANCRHRAGGDGPLQEAPPGHFTIEFSLHGAYYAINSRSRRKCPVNFFIPLDCGYDICYPYCRFEPEGFGRD